MSPKEHYDMHLAPVYSWMLGNFSEKMEEQKGFFQRHGISPTANGKAIDLGAGNGIQSVALAHLGFSVLSVDSNKQLLSELTANKASLSIQVLESDILEFVNQQTEPRSLIVCMGDTLTHLKDAKDVELLLKKIFHLLISGGKVVFSFRDLSNELKGSDRFLLVRADENRIMNCFLEYFSDFVMVHDTLVEKIPGRWVQKVSAYPKLRLNENNFAHSLERFQFKITAREKIHGMSYIVAEK
jgi:SAM-dependent methyltransferase